MEAIAIVEAAQEEGIELLATAGLELAATRDAAAPAATGTATIPGAVPIA